MKFKTKKDLAVYLTNKNSLQYKIALHPATKKVCAWAKDTGKNYLIDGLKIFYMENNFYSNCVTLRKTETSAKENLLNSFFKNKTRLNNLGYETTEYLDNKHTGIIKKNTTKRGSEKFYNQQDKMGSLINLDKIAGDAPFNGGAYTVMVMDEVVSITDVQSDKMLDAVICKNNEKNIINSLGRRHLLSAQKNVSLIKKQIKQLKYKDNFRKCDSCRSKSCYDFHHTPKTTYSKKICKKKLLKLKELKETLKSINEKMLHLRFFVFMNPWNSNFYYLKETEKFIPKKKWINFLFPKCFNFNYFLEKYNNLANEGEVIEEILLQFNKHKNKIWKRLKKNTYKFYYDKYNDAVYSRATIFSNPVYGNSENNNQIEQTKNIMREIKKAIVTLDTWTLVEHLGIPNDSPSSNRRLTYNTRDWKLIDDTENEIKTILQSKNCFNLWLTFGIDVDISRRYTISPLLKYDIEKNEKVETRVFALPIIEIKSNAKQDTQKTQEFIVRKIEKFLVENNLITSKILKSIIIDINGGAFADFLKIEVNKVFGKGFFKLVKRIDSVTGSFEENILKGWGILSRQNFVQELCDHHIIYFSSHINNRELIETFEKIKKDDNGKRIEAARIDSTGINFNKAIDTVNAFELALWTFRVNLKKFLIRKRNY